MCNNVYFVTGGTGYLGIEIVKKLSKIGCKVYVLSRNSKESTLLQLKNVHIIEGNIIDEFSVPLDVSVIVNSAGIINQHDSNLELVNTNSLRYICEISLKRKILLIHISSAGVYFKKEFSTITENSICKADNFYEASKLNAENIIESFKNQGLKYYILQPSSIFGKKRDKGKDSFNKLIKLLITNKFIHINHGDGIYNLVHINDVVNAVLLLSKSNKYLGSKYILNQDITFKEFADIVLIYCGRMKPLYSINKHVVFLFILLIKPVFFLLNISKYSPISIFNALTNTTKFSQSKIIHEQNFEPENNIVNNLMEYLHYQSNHYNE